MDRHRLGIGLILLGVAGLGAACVSPPGQPVVVERIPAPAQAEEFRSLEDLIVSAQAASTPSAPLVREQIIPPASESANDVWPIRERGIASWYLDRRTASGERYSRFAFTAAHRTLPFGTVVLVRNLDNGREVVVRVTDRGPFVDGRIIDLSEAAARRVGIYSSGLARVEIEVLILPPSETAPGSGPAAGD